MPHCAVAAPLFQASPGTHHRGQSPAILSLFFGFFVAAFVRVDQTHPFPASLRPLGQRYLPSWCDFLSGSAKVSRQ